MAPSYLPTKVHAGWFLTRLKDATYEYNAIFGSLDAFVLINETRVLNRFQIELRLEKYICGQIALSGLSRAKPSCQVRYI